MSLTTHPEPSVDVHDAAAPATRAAMTDPEHVAAGGALCPFCRRDTVEGGSVETGSGRASQPMWCLHCDAAWLDLYELRGWLQRA